MNDTINSTEVKFPRVINQVDLVPSLAMLMGYPIPYTSLGQIIPELFTHAGKKIDDHSNDYLDDIFRTGDALLPAFEENAKQVNITKP